jgi:hypothetical protein
MSAPELMAAGGDLNNCDIEDGDEGLWCCRFASPRQSEAHSTTTPSDFLSLLIV